MRSDKVRYGQIRPLSKRLKKYAIIFADVEWKRQTNGFREIKLVSVQNSARLRVHHVGIHREVIAAS